MPWKKGNLWYVSRRMRDGSGRKHSLPFKTFAEAEFFQRGIDPTTGDPVVENVKIDEAKTDATFWQLFLHAIERCELAQEGNFHAVKNHIVLWRDRTASSLRRDDVSKMCDHWKKTYAHNTVYNYCSQLRRILRAISMYEPSISHLWKAVPKISMPVHRQQTVSDQDFWIVYKEVPLYVKFVMLVCRCMTLRFMEAYQLCPDSIDFHGGKHGIVTFIKKGGKATTMPVPEMVREFIDSYATPIVKNKSEKYISILAGGPRSGRRCRRYIERVIQKHGLAKWNFHDLRRTGATKAKDKTHGDLIAVRDLLGHQRVATTEAYIAASSKRELLEIMELAKPERVQGTAL